MQKPMKRINIIFLTNRKKMFRYFMFLVLLTMSNSIKAKTISILFESDKYPISVKLLKYTNAFEKEFISEFVINEPYIFTKNISEIDTYILERSDRSKFLVFFWDGDIEIKIKSDCIDKSSVLKSFCSKENEQFNESLQVKIFRKIRKLDTLIAKFQIHRSLVSLDSLRAIKVQRDSLFHKGQEDYIQFIRQYLKEHPKSFVALYWMQMSDIVPNESERQILRNMPLEYKENQRYLILMNR